MAQLEQIFCSHVLLAYVGLGDQCPAYFNSLSYPRYFYSNLKVFGLASLCERYLTLCLAQRSAELAPKVNLIPSFPNHRLSCQTIE